MLTEITTNNALAVKGGKGIITCKVTGLSQEAAVEFAKGTDIILTIASITAVDTVSRDLNLHMLKNVKKSMSHDNEGTRKAFC